MVVDTKMLGSGCSPTSTCVANFLWFVSSNPESVLVHLTCSRSGTPAWKRLADHSLTSDERISLITAIFFDRSEIEVVGRLRGDDAQSFVDVMDQVLSHFPAPDFQS